MSSMIAVNSTSAGRRSRRSKRLGLSVPVMVHGKDSSGKPFGELTRAGYLNAHGAQLTLSCMVEELQTILVENKNTREEQECRVVSVATGENGKWKVGVEFTRQAAGFWEIYFPPMERGSRP
jgi:hypothetical protein